VIEKALYIAGCDFALGNLKEARAVINSVKDVTSTCSISDVVTDSPVEVVQPRDAVLSSLLEYNLGVMRSKKGFDYSVAHRHFSTSLECIDVAMQQLDALRLQALQKKNEQHEVILD
jgi:hypothetical protein